MAAPRLTPLGTSPAWYNPGEPTTGFLLDDGETRILIDCGSGVFARYLVTYPDQPLTAVIISHIHADHMLDLIPFAYGILYGGLQDWETQLWLPPGGHDRLKKLISAWDGDDDFFDQAYRVSSYSPASAFDVGGFTVSSHEVPHYIESFALRFDHDNGSLGYTSDLGPTPTIGSFMSGVDLLLAEATLVDVPAENPEDRGHITGEEAGIIAREARAHSLLLTHIPDDRKVQVVKDARAAFGGPVAAAESLATYELAQRLARVG